MCVCVCVCVCVRVRACACVHVCYMCSLLKMNIVILINVKLSDKSVQTFCERSSVMWQKK